MCTRGLIAVVFNGKICLYWSRSDSFPNHLGRILCRLMNDLQSCDSVHLLTDPNIFIELIPDEQVEYKTNENCNTIDDVMMTYQQNVLCEYIYVLENTEAGEFKVTFSDAFIECTSEYTQDYVQLTQIEFERVVEHWSDLSTDGKWCNASVEDKRWLVATLDPQMRHMGACNIQKIWRGHHARWKCPCFSFNDTDGTVPLCKKRRTK